MSHVRFYCRQIQTATCYMAEDIQQLAIAEGGSLTDVLLLLSFFLFFFLVTGMSEVTRDPISSASLNRIQIND